MEITSVSASSRNSQSSPVQPRLVHAAHEFEGQMMKELLKPMTTSSGLTGGEDDDSGSGGALGEFATECLGRALSEQGGFGIAHQIIGDLGRSGNNSGGTEVTANLHNNT